MPPSRARTLRALVPLLLGAVLGACAGTPEPDPRYAPTRSVLEVVAVLRHHVPDDTYRFEPARDFTGRNVYRASLIRLENLERVHAGALEAGHLDDVIAFSKGRALERLRAFDLAAAAYRRAAGRDGPLREEAERSAAVCERLAAAAAMAPEMGADDGASGAPTPDFSSVIAVHTQRVALLEALEAEVAGTHHAFVVREEIERADEDRARAAVARRHVDPDGDVRALAELQRVASRHPESKRRSRHLLALADLYAALASEYVEARPPEGLRFDPPAFQELVDSAARLYEVVANQDGTPEKLEAERRLEAFLAFTLQVDRDRLSP